MKKLIIILIVATFLAYFSSFGNPFIWDDEQFIISNVYVQKFDVADIFTQNTIAGAGLLSNYYRPLTTLSFAVDTKIWGTTTFGFHLTNVSFHIAAGLVLFFLLAELGMGQIGSFFVALFFLIHPIQTEAVTYINSRGDSLYAFFLFASLWLFTRLLSFPRRRESKELRTGSRVEARDDNKKWIISIGIVATFICSLLSKEIALAGIGLFAAIFLFYWLQQQFTINNVQLTNKFQRTKYEIPNTKYILWTMGGILGVIAVYILLRLTLLHFGNVLNYYGYENEYTRSLAIRLFTFCKVIWIYLGLLVWPHPLHMERAVELVRTFFSPWVLSFIGLAFATGVLGMVEFKKRGTGWILFGGLWFVTMLVPTSGIIPINGLLYEHWLYVPLIGFSILIYGLWQLLALSLRGTLATWQSHIRLLYSIRNDGRRVMISFILLLSILYIILTIHQNNLWADPVVFYRYTLSFAPDSARLYNNLGMTLANEGKVKEAIPEYEKALSLGYDYPQIYNNLGNAQVATGDYANAEENLKKALELAPNFEVARLNLIKLYVTSKQWDKALGETRGNEMLIREIQVIEENK